MQALSSSTSTRAPTGAKRVVARSTCILMCEACADACTVWADACVSEPGLDRVLDSIRLDLACAEICRATANVIASFPDARFARAQLRACSEACRACAIASREYQAQHASCRACARACEACHHVVGGEVMRSRRSWAIAFAERSAHDAARNQR
jgi:hypothetical protein